MKMSSRRQEIVEQQRKEGLRWVRELSTQAYYRYCYDRRFNLVSPQEHKVDKLVFITEEQFKHYEEGKKWVRKRPIVYKGAR